MTTYLLLLLLSFVLCYCFGSIIFGVIISKITSGVDVRKQGSGNAGATNVMRTVGVGAAIATFLCDSLKCAAAVLICKYLILIPASAGAELPELLKIEYMTYLLGFFAMLGHSYPLFFHFKGGKAVSSAIGVLFCINWQIALFVLLIFIVCVVLTRIVSLGSVLGAVQFIVLSFVYSAGNPPLIRLYITALSMLIGGLVILRHKDNIKRLLAGEETAMKPKSGG